MSGDGWSIMETVSENWVCTVRKLLVGMKEA